MSSEYSYLTCSSTRLSTAIRKSTCPFEVPYISQLSGARRIVRIGSYFLTPISLLRKGSASTRLWEPTRVPSERYEPRPCVCVFVACFDRRIFYYSSKTDSPWGCVAKVTASHLLMARPRHCLSAIHGWALPKQ